MSVERPDGVDATIGLGILAAVGGGAAMVLWFVTGLLVLAVDMDAPVPQWWVTWGVLGLLSVLGGAAAWMVGLAMEANRERQS